MDPRFTGLPEKVKLGGADCFHMVLDTHAKNHSAGGNVVRMAFFLSEKVELSAVKERLQSMPVIHWLCNITLKAGGPFAIPYWEYKDHGRSIRVREHIVDDAAVIPDSAFADDIPLDSKCFIEAEIFHDREKSTILFSWNHILLDGRGSGMLIDQINKPKESIPLKAFFPSESRSSNFFSYMKNMFEVKKFIEKSAKPPIASVATGRESAAAKFRFHVLRFDHEETKKIELNARKNGTRFGVNSFLIAACCHASDKLIKSKGRKGTLWIPVPYDGRLRGAFGPVISNNVSSVFYTVPQEKLQDIKTTVAHITTQMNDQLRNEMPKKYNSLLDLMRHIPGKIYYKLISNPGEGALASFLFTATGEGIGDLKTFFDKPVKDVVIYEPQTFPPGLTYLFLRYNNTLKVNICYSEAVISPSELATLENDLRSIFLSNE